MFAPSKATSTGCRPTENVPSVEPSNALSLLTVFAPKFATQIFAPSNAMPHGRLPQGNVPTTAPSLARSLVTLALNPFAAHMCVPSNAAALGPLPPVENWVGAVLAAYHLRIAIWLTFKGGVEEPWESPPCDCCACDTIPKVHTTRITKQDLLIIVSLVLCV